MSVSAIIFIKFINVLAKFLLLFADLVFVIDPGSRPRSLGSRGDLFGETMGQPMNPTISRFPLVAINGVRDFLGQL